MKKIIAITVIFSFLSVSGVSFAKESANNSSDAIAAQLLTVKKKSKRINLLIMLADLYRTEGHMDKSLSTCKEALAEDTDTKQKQKIYRIMGDVYSAKKEWSNAIPAYQDAITYSPGHEGVRISLARAFEQSDLYELAKQEYQKVIEMNSKSFDANFGLANLYQKGGFENKAIRYYRAALSSKMDATAYSNLAVCYEARGDTSLALSMLKSAIAIEPAYKDYINLGGLYCENKKYKEAEAAYGMAEKMDSKTVDAYIYLWLLYIDENELESAKKILARGDAMCPGNALIHFFLGTIYQKKGMPALAMQELKKSSELALSPALKDYSERYLAFIKRNSK